MSNISNLFGYAKFCNIDCCWTYWELKSEKISWLNQHDKFNKHIIRMINNVNCHRFFIDFSQDQRYYLNTLKWKYRIRHIQYYWFLQSEKNKPGQIQNKINNSHFTSFLIFLCVWSVLLSVCVNLVCLTLRAFFLI